MLENNTDRSYFMIGAMVVAGILIIAAGVIFGDVVIEYLKGAMGSLESSIPEITMPDPPEGSPGA